MQVTIDGESYTKETGNAQTIGIGITTHNRNKLCRETVEKIQAVTPNARIVIVDDASQYDLKIPDVEIYKFYTNVGIARAKNKCLELLADCQDIFLFDDDTYPTKSGWWKPYVDSSEPHLMYLFENWGSGKPVGDDQIVYEDGKIVAHTHGRGCMMYIDRKVLDVVGGMDVRYGKAMEEHLDWSQRIYNAGLTSFKYADIPGSEDLIHSMDQHKEVISSISKPQRAALYQRNAKMLEEARESTTYAPYGKDVVIACYFAGVPDAQREGKKWAADETAINKLRQSVQRKGLEFVLIHNCFDLPNLTTISRSPYFERWFKEWQYLRDHPEINNVFVVDATDVDMLNNPFTHIESGKLYVGDEPSQTIGCDWLVRNHPNNAQYFIQNANKTLLNCGVVGGNRQIVMDLLQDMYRYGFWQHKEQTEMGIFNYLCHTKYADRVEYGRHVTTLFKRFETSSSAWFRHK